MTTMERNASKLPALGDGEVYYWVKIASYACLIVEELKKISIKQE